jgi:protein-tyrosine phosphatase
MDTTRIAEVPVAWIPQDALALQGRLGFCPAPGRWLPDDELDPERHLEGDLTALSERGTTTLVVLLEHSEMQRIGLEGLLDKASGAGLEVFWLPIADGTAPSDLESTARLVEKMVERLAAGRTVVAHCHGGIGRSGAIVAACIVAAGAHPARALEVVRSARAGAATAPGQEEFVHAFAGAWARRGAGSAGVGTPASGW